MTDSVRIHLESDRSLSEDDMDKIVGLVMDSALTVTLAYDVEYRCDKMVELLEKIAAATNDEENVVPKPLGHVDGTPLMKIVVTT